MRRLLAIPVLGLLLACANGPGEGGAGDGGTSDGGTGDGSAADGSAGEGGGASSSSGSATGSSSSSGGGPDGGATGDARADAATLAPPTCANPAHVLPLDPANPQSGITLGGFYVDTDTWNAANYRVTQTLYVCDYNDWYVVANMDDSAGDGAVKTYPNVHEDFTGAPALSSFKALTTTFAHTAPHVGIYEFAYDIWLDGVATSGSTEVMIWTDNFHQVPSGSSQETVTLGGQSYQVYKSGSYIAFVETANVTAGTLDLLSFFDHIMAKGWIPAGSTLGAVDYGVELVSTAGADATFQVSAFSLTAQ